MTSPETRICQNCKASFVIDASNFAFYERINVPPPTFCWECRMQRRFVWRNERALHKRKCDLCGRVVIAMYPRGTEFPVYCQSCWHSDKWDGCSYGRDYDFSHDFFSQFRDLQRVVPRVALQSDNCVNCDHANQIANCKNCYLVSSSSEDEDCYYSYRTNNSRKVMDSTVMLRTDTCYDCIECLGSARLRYVENAADTLESAFLYDAVGCTSCFMSSNLRRASHIFRNKVLSKEEYESKIKVINLGSYKVVEECRTEFNALKCASLHGHADTKNVTNFTGHVGSNAKDCHYCFSVGDVENARYCYLVNDSKDVMDVNNGCCTMELVYEANSVGIQCSNLRFVTDIWPNGRDIQYSDSCKSNVADLFGCISLRGKQYCILNKQYTKKEYDALVSKIIEHMNAMPYVDRKGRVYKYGEFFPPELSPFAYNESFAQEYFPLTRASAEGQGYRWREAEKRNYQITKPAADLPDDIRDTPDSILNEIISCAHEGKCNQQCATAFRIIPEELQFYRQYHIPLPRLCPNCRHYERLALRNPLKLWHRKCQCAGKGSENGVYANTAKHPHGGGKCPNEFQTSYSPERPEIVYCEACYNAEVV